LRLKVFSGRVAAEANVSVLSEGRFPGASRSAFLCLSGRSLEQAGTRDELADAIWESPPAT